MSALTCRSLRKNFGGLTAVADLSMEVPKGRITSLIGPNGAGKTTAFNLITGFLPPDGGSAKFAGQELVSHSPDAIARLGIARSFQDIRLFGNMTVIENVMAGFQGQSGESLLQLLFTPRRVAREQAALREQSMALVRFVGLEHRATVLADELSYGQQKLCMLARLLAMDPAMLLLDEPCSGLDPNMLQKMMDLLQTLVAQGKTILLIEHNMDIVRALSHHVVFLNEGNSVAAGDPAAILADKQLAALYFGM